MSALSNGGQYDVCSCSECSGVHRVERVFIYYNCASNVIKLYRRNKNGWYGFINSRNRITKAINFEIGDVLIGQWDEQPV